MPIVPLSKVTLCSLVDDKEVVLDRLQSLGCVHVVPLKNLTNPPTAASADAHNALKYLQACPVRSPFATRDEGFDFGAIVAEALDTQRQELDLRDEWDDTQQAIELATTWGDFAVPSPDSMTGLRLWFYLVPPERVEELATLGYVWQSVPAEGRHGQVVVLSHEEPTAMPGNRVELDPRSLSELRRRMARIELAMNELELRRAALSRWIPWIQRSMTLADDRASLERVKGQTLDDDRIFAVQGWAPNKTTGALEAFAKQQGLALTIEPPSEEDSPPTLFQNPKLVSGGQDTVQFYITPGYNSWDPSVLVLFSFALFFAMILSDAGYSLILAGITAAKWRALGKSPAGERFRYELAIISAFSILWGVAIGSYFGVAAQDVVVLGPLLELLRISWLDSNNTPRMMSLSIYIGITHILLANAITAWRYFGSWKAMVPIGWILCTFGGLAAALAYFHQFDDDQNTLWMNAGLGLIGVGVSFVIFFTSSRPLPPRGVGDLIMRILEGLPALMGLSALLGDSLSYLRLFALGMAGGKLAATLNDMSGQMAAALGGVGVLIAIVLLLFGHTLNLVLGVMGGVVHGLRLNFIEFFNWSALDEGYPFQAFSKKVGDEWKTGR